MLPQIPRMFFRASSLLLSLFTLHVLGQVTFSDLTSRDGGDAGLVVLVEPGDTALAAQLAGTGKHLVLALSESPASVAQWDAAFAAANLHPLADAKHWRSPARLPFHTHSVNTLVLNQATFDRLGSEEVLRVIVPGHGFALVDGVELRKPRPEGMDVWLGRNRDATGNRASHDDLQPPNSIRWLGGRQGIPAGQHIITDRVHYIHGDNSQFGQRYTTQFGRESRDTHARDAFSGVSLWLQHRERGGYINWDWIVFTDGERLFLPVPNAGRSIGNNPRSRLDMQSVNLRTGEVIEPVLPLIEWNEHLQNQTILQGDWGINNFFTHRVITTGDRIFFADGLSKVRALSADGTQLIWEKILPEGEYADMVASDGEHLVLLISSTFDNPFMSMRRFPRHDNIAKALVGLNPDTGAELWRYTGVEGFALKYLICEFGAVVVSSHLNDPQKAQPEANQSGIPSFEQVDNNFLASLNAATGAEHFRKTGRADFMDVPGLRGHRAGLNITPQHIVFNESEVAYVWDLFTGARVHENTVGRTGYYTRHSAITLNWLIRNGVFSSFDGSVVDSTADRVSVEDYMGFSKPANNMFYMTSGFRSSSGSQWLGDQLALAREPEFPAMLSNSQRLLVSGTASGIAEPAAADWPTFRGDFARRAWRPADGPGGPLELAWTAQLPLPIPANGTLPYAWTMNSDVPGPVTQPVADAQRVLFSVPDRHELVCLNLFDGSERWRTRLSGRVAAPPTLAGEAAFVGVNDGTVSAINLDTGAVIWTFLAAPYERIHNAHQQIESTHPVRSSPVLHNGLLYVAAGRHGSIDTGIHVWALDPATGVPQLHRQVTVQQMNDVLQLVGGNLRLPKVDLNPADLSTVSTSLAPAVNPNARGHDGGHGWIGPTPIWMGAHLRSGTGVFGQHVGPGIRAVTQQDDRFSLFDGETNNIYREVSSADHNVVLREISLGRRISRRFMVEFMAGAGRYRYLAARNLNHQIEITMIDSETGSVNTSTVPVSHAHEEVIPDGIAISNGMVLVTTTLGRVLAFVAPQPPVAPSNLTVTTVSRQQLDLNWQDNANNEQDFEIERSADGVTWTPAVSVGVNVTQYSDSGLTADSTYFYRVRAVNSSGASAWSAVASGATLPNPTVAPTAPAGLTATVVSESVIALAWTHSGEIEDGYEVERSLDGSTWMSVTTLPPGSLALQDSGLAPSTAYWHRVRAFNLVGPSAWVSVGPTDTLSLGAQISTLFTINHGSFNPETGAFTRAAGDSYQGLVAHFDPVLLSEAGQFVELSFTWSGGANDNQQQAVVWGLFSGDPVSGNVQTPVTSAWEGYFMAISRRNGQNTLNSGVYRQGAGAAPLINHPTQSGSNTNFAVNGNGGRVNGSPTWNGATNSEGLVRVERLSATQIQATYRYPTGYADGYTRNETVDGISVQMAVADGMATVRATHTLAAGGPTTLNAVVFAGGQSFTVRNVVVRATENNGGGPPPAPPAAPIELNAVPLSSSQIQLSWVAGDNAATHFVLETQAGGGAWEALATLPASVTAFLHSGLPAESLFRHRILARNDAGDSAWLTGDEVYTLPESQLPPPAPTQLTATAASSSLIALSWLGSGQESGFRIERSPNGSTWALLTELPAGTETHADSGLTADTQYFYRVSAFNSAGVSSPSQTASARTLAAPGGLSGLFVLNQGTWNSSTGAFTRGGTDRYQGLVASFPTVQLAETGDFVELNFTWSGGAPDNTGQGVVWGLFSGGEVSADAQTAVTGGWTGFFHAQGVRHQGNNPNGLSGVYRQGSGSTPLINHVTQEGTHVNFSVDGAGARYVNSAHEAAFHGRQSPARVRLERISATQVRFSTQFRTDHSNRSGSGTANGVPYTVNVSDGVATVTSTHPVAEEPFAVNGVVFAGRGNFSLSNLTLAKSLPSGSGDINQNGIPDAWETEHFGSLDQTPETITLSDGRVVPTRHLYIAGLNPHAPGRGFEIAGIRLAPTGDLGARLNFHAMPGRRYDLLHTHSLLAGDLGWSVILSGVHADNQEVELLLNHPEPLNFYKLRVRVAD